MPAGVKRPLRARRKPPTKTVEITNPSLRVSKTIGNLEYSIIFHDRTMTYILEKNIAIEVAERIARLEDVKEILTIERQGNLNIICNLSNAASLKDVLNLKAYRSFILSDCKLLVTDVVAGISALHTVGLQRNKLYLEDILLVGQRGTFYFQIAGIENCTCIEGHEPTNSSEMESFRELLTFVAERLEKEKEKEWIQDLLDSLRERRVLDSATLHQVRIYLGLEAYSFERQGLEEYVQAVQATVTPVGEKCDENSEVCQDMESLLVLLETQRQRDR